MSDNTEQLSPTVQALLRDAAIADTPAANTSTAVPPQPAQPGYHPDLNNNGYVPPQVQYVPVPVPQPTPAPQEQKPPSLLDLVTDEERQTYADALPMITRLIQAATDPVAQQAARAQEELRRVQESQDQGFVATVRGAVRDMDTIVNDQRWERWLNSYVAGTSFTQRDALAHAHGNRNLAAVATVFDGFRQATGMAQQTAVPYGNGVPFSTTPAAATAVVPQTAQVPTTPAATPPQLKWSTYENASREYTKGNMSRADLMSLKAVYDAAINEGRVNYNS